MYSTRIGIEILLWGDDSDGRLSVVDETLPAGFEGPPVHVHPTFDEGWYVLEGELTFHLDGELVTKGPGSLVYANRGTPHTLANLGTEDARALVLCTPAGFERYFARLKAEQDGVEPPARAAGPIPETTMVGSRIGA